MSDLKMNSVNKVVHPVTGVTFVFGLNNLPMMSP